MKRCFFVTHLSLLIVLSGAGQASPGSSQQNPATSKPPAVQSADAPRTADAPASPDTQTLDSGAQVSNYNKAIFQDSIPTDHLAFLKKFDGTPAGDLARDSRFRKLMKNVIPDCMFHYGRDMPLMDAMDIVLNGSDEPVHLRDDRYLMVVGHRGPYLMGRGFLWFDLQDGIALGAFFFRPTNGEPTPALNVFSRQVREEFLAMSELPPAFAEDLNHWMDQYRISPITTRYFITGSNRKILLEHDENYCLAGDADPTTPSPGAGDDPAGFSPVPANDGTPRRATAAAAPPPPSECERMNADAAEIDMDAASYLEQTHHVTNATAWMITGQDQKIWLQARVATCGDLLSCRIPMTRERVRIIIGRPPIVRGPIIRKMPGKPSIMVKH